MSKTLPVSVALDATPVFGPDWSAKENADTRRCRTCGWSRDDHRGSYHMCPDVPAYSGGFPKTWSPR